MANIIFSYVPGETFWIDEAWREATLNRQKKDLIMWIERRYPDATMKEKSKKAGLSPTTYRVWKRKFNL